MKKFDYYLQEQRIKKALPYIKKNEKILDIGCGDAALFKYLLKANIPFWGMGIDSTLEKDIETPNYILIKDHFPSERSRQYQFSAITLLAVLEHIPENELNHFAAECFSALDKEGKIILTVPSKKVDFILAILKTFRIIDGMELEEHHGFDQKKTKQIFEQAGFKLVIKKYFQFGLNNLYVFTK